MKKTKRIFYSGKKKKHTVKNAVICNAAGIILLLSPTVDAKMHVKKMADTLYSILEDFGIWQDAGYQGYNSQGVSVH